MEIRTKRIYDPASGQDGFRVLVDRLWPRGVSKERAALDLWQTDWATLTAMPSRLTAEPMHREARARFMARTASEGCVTGYEGIRISAAGRRFRIEDAIIWNLDSPVSATGPAPAGQAATFARWTFL